MADNHAHPYNRIGRVQAINDLPDDDLLAIFDFCVFGYQYLGFFQLSQSDIEGKIESWQSLVHVCRRWRCLVFESARCLNLRLLCKLRKRRKSLDVWPALPLILLGSVFSVDDVIPELEHSDRICQIQLSCVATSPIEDSSWIAMQMTAMQVPFPELVALHLSLPGGPNEPALPDSFLGGSAPRLRHLALASIPFPGLPKLLLSSTQLVHLNLQRIPHSGYISPEAMATCLSALTNLEQLYFHFKSPRPSPDQESRRPPPPTRSVLPALTMFGFKGINEYLEDFVSRIESPRLCRLSITLFDDIDFDTPELKQFISRTPRIGGYNEAYLIFDPDHALVKLESHPEQSDYHRMVKVKILRQAPVRQLSSLARICTSPLRHLLTLDNLYFDVHRYILHFRTDDGIENTDWLNILHPFTAVKNLYLSQTFWPHIAPALQELTGGRTTEVLPALENVLLEGFQPSEPVHEGIAEFISARQLSHPVVISVWDRG